MVQSSQYWEVLDVVLSCSFNVFGCCLTMFFRSFSSLPLAGDLFCGTSWGCKKSRFYNGWRMAGVLYCHCFISMRVETVHALY